MQNISRRKRPIGALSSYGDDPAFQNIYGEDVRDSDTIFKRLESFTLPQAGGATPPIHAPQDIQEAPLAQELPKVPPSARSTDPWSKQNVRRTLLDLGGAFLSNDDFFGAMGNASQALGGRMDQLKAEATPKRQYGVGPDQSYEAVTDPVTGETTFQRIDAFKQAIDEERQAARDAKQPVMTPEDIIELRSRAMSSIMELPENERAQAYQELISNPAAFGGIDTTGMPQSYDPRYAKTVGGMGLTSHQMQQMALREADLRRKEEADRVRASQGQARLSQGQQRINQSPANRARSSPKPPSGFIVD